VRRFAEDRIRKDLSKKIVLLAGARQAGKTTLSRQLGLKHAYLNFDSAEDRKLLRLRQWDRQVEIVILVREVRDEIEPADALQRILTVGGFPEPFLSNDQNEARRWRRTHIDSILREDLLDLEKVRALKSIELLVELLTERVSSTVSFSSLARDLEVSAHTVKHWLEILENLYVIFAVRPFHTNVARSILKESKYYFYDTGALAQAGVDQGAVFENAVACALARELHLTEDFTGRKASLCFLRAKEKREVDFLVLIDRTPQQLIEAKWADDTFSRSLGYFRNLFPAARALQVVRSLDRPREDRARSLRMLPAADYLAEISFLEDIVRPRIRGARGLGGP